MDKLGIAECFNEVETVKKHSGYFYSVTEAIVIALMGAFCGLQDMKQIIKWAEDERISAFFREHFGIERVPCYSWFTQLLGVIKPESFSKCFTKWVLTHLVSGVAEKTLSLDGKTVRSTGKMKGYDNPLHIVSAQLAEFGITFAQTAVDGKSNEIPAVQELLGTLDIKGSMIVADALNCQKETVKAVIDGGADYLFPVKGNQSTLATGIKDYVEDEELRGNMDKCEKSKKNRDRFEKRTAYTTSDIDWLPGRGNWAKITSIGALHTHFETAKETSDEWHYYISSMKLSAEALLSYARKEWSVESMHYLLDVHI